MVKRVVLFEHEEFASITFYNDNPQYGPITYPMSQYDNDIRNAIIGKVVWAWSDMSRK